MKKKSSIPAIVITGLLILILSAVVYSILSIIDTDGFVEANIVRVEGNTIVLGRDCLAIVADTTEERAQSIQDGLLRTIIGRPNTHDIFVATLKTFNITLDVVKMTTFDGKNYFADMILVSGEKILTLDSRPSDAIAIAVRTNTTILINESLLLERGEDICI